MSKTTLHEARRAAAELARLEQARSELPRIERQERLEQARAAAQERLDELAPQLQDAASGFRTARMVSDAHLADALAEFTEAVRERRALAERAGALRRLAQEIASATWRRDHAGQAQDQQTRFDVQALREQILIDAGFPNAQIMVLPEPGDEIARRFATAISGLSGDVVASRPEIAALSGRVAVQKWDPIRGENVTSWE